MDKKKISKMSTADVRMLSDPKYELTDVCV
jgi:hypothetical protein